MAKNESWRPRKPRKRGFDDDTPEFGGSSGGWAPPPPSFATGGPPIIRSPSVFASGPELKATVKWFNPEKGFGFVELGDGSGDAFLHVSVLQRVGADAVNPGAGLRIRVGPGQKGQQVTEVLEITSQGDATPAPRGAPAGGGYGDRGGDRAPDRGGFGSPRPPRAPMGGGGGGGFMPQGDAQELRGTVKWYSAEKGFGFVSPEGGGRDVFVHATALERSGLTPLTEGQAVNMKVVQGKKGPEAATLTKD